MIIVTGEMHTDRETFPILYGRLRSLCEPSRTEDGCIFYHITIEDEAKGIILATEGWRDKQALAAHLGQPMIASLLADLGDRYTSHVKIYDVASSQALEL